MMITALVKSTRAPAPVGEAALVEDLEERLEHVAVRLLDLVEQDHLVGPPAHRLGELPAGLVADVAGRRADEPRDRVRLGVLGEIEARHRVGRVEERLGDRLGGLGLADAGGAEQQERADWAARRGSPRRCGGARCAMRASAAAWPTTRSARSSSRREHALAVGLEEALHRARRPARRRPRRPRVDARRLAPPRACARARRRDRGCRHGLVGQRLARQVAHAPGDRRGERLLGVRACRDAARRAAPTLSSARNASSGRQLRRPRLA